MTNYDNREESANIGLLKEMSSLRDIIENNSDWFWEVDTSGRYTFSSTKSIELLGRLPHEVVGKTPFDFMPKDEARRVGKIFAEIAAARIPFSGLQNRNIRADGSEVLVETSGVPLFDDNGEFKGYRGIDRNLSNLSNDAGKRLFELESIYSSAPAGLCFIDTTLRYVTVNDYLAELLGKNTLEINGRKIADFLPSIIPILQSALLKAYCNESIPDAEFQMPDKTRVFFMRINAARYPNGQVSGLSVAMIDISPLKEMEEKLRSSKQHYRNMVELNPQIPWTASPDGMITDVSSRFEKITGLTREQALADKWLRTIHLDDRHPTLIRWEQALQTRQPLDVEIRFCHVEKGWNWMRIRAVPSIDDNGDVLCWYGTAEDIHERKLLELKLVKANRRLEIQARTDSLTKLPNRRAFKKVLAHEFMRAKRSNSPLAVLMIDIDYFKNFNDCYGHISGDACLRLVARALRKSLKRSTDIVARYGGEEFAAILPDTDQRGASLVAEHILQSIRAMGIKHSDSKFRKVTISLGLTIYQANQHVGTTDQADLMLAADQALYYSKKNGRNQFNLAELPC
ncbi:diguanylate cyclase [Yersinia intermedia]|jgi:diguanylate cyclase (GGDEF)-like protein/PAS domain S-box-containing protein|uniref:diguanylate cyclase n=1 Tax=Yersinia intermedia TaxID=631 RepID=A0A209A4E7_YERIN|nr:diguanylate cyclase [Yersinia intermedia]MCB5320847.1 diguanylate cyclase [Yersinia intermedia]OVZ87621.1 diguanylate cyclase [Yersinia intermedia]WET13848.1 diguanylate cyclase [Yersinia intermedia]